MRIRTSRPRDVVAQARSIIDQFDAASPHTAGRVRQTIGGILVADGLVGLENPLDGKRSRPGILGAVVVMLFGVVWLVLPLWGLSDGPDTDATTVGQVSHVQDDPTSNSCPLTGTFTVDGVDYTVRSRVDSSGNCDLGIGSPIEVNYDSIDPRMNEVAGEKGFLYIFVGIGLLGIAWGAIVLVIRAASIVVGARLYVGGKRQADEHPPTPGDEGVAAAAREKLTAVITGVRADLAQTAPVPAMPPAGPAASSHPVAPAVTAQDVVSPLPGWYLTEDGTHVRWFDGKAWTPHVRPVPQG